MSRHLVDCGLRISLCDTLGESFVRFCQRIVKRLPDAGGLRLERFQRNSFAANSLFYNDFELAYPHGSHSLLRY